jgi:hypothetical protein
MDVTYCMICGSRETCQRPCEELQTFLKLQESHPLSGSSTLSSDYMDNVFEMEVLEESAIELAKIARKERKERAKAISGLISYFGEITGEEGESLKYFLIWKMKQEEKLKDWQIAEIMGLSRSRVTQILLKIRDSIEKDR